MKKIKLLFCCLLLLNIFSSTSIIAQTVTLYSLPSPHKICWRNPNLLLLSTVRNFYAKAHHQPLRPIGHLFVELQKDSTSIFTGIIPTHKTDLKQLVVKKKYGLGILFKTVEGRLEKSSEIVPELNYRMEKGRAAFISFKISDSAYQYLRCYIDSFVARGYDKMYGGKNKPRCGEGCGCTAFGISFLELINIMQPEYAKQWAVQADVPNTLIGDEQTGKRINCFKILFSFRWAKKNTPCTHLSLYDPYLIYHWINTTWDREHKKATGLFKLKKINRAKGLEVDCNKTGVPQMPMFIRQEGK